jgi:hypothetical protein
MIKLRYIARKIENQTINIYKNENFQFETAKSQIINDGIECLYLISSILGQNTFMYENRYDFFTC